MLTAKGSAGVALSDEHDKSTMNSHKGTTSPSQENGSMALIIIFMTCSKDKALGIWIIYVRRAAPDSSSRDTIRLGER